jgi:hypothetical protein
MTQLEDLVAEVLAFSVNSDSVALMGLAKEAVDDGAAQSRPRAIFLFRLEEARSWRPDASADGKLAACILAKCRENCAPSGFGNGLFIGPFSRVLPVLLGREARATDAANRPKVCRERGPGCREDERSSQMK